MTYPQVIQFETRRWELERELQRLAQRAEKQAPEARREEPRSEVGGLLPEAPSARAA